MAAIVFVIEVAGLLIRARHYTRIQFEYARMSAILAYALLVAAGLWLLYLAFEPYVRKFWPHLLIGWTRLLSGRVRDPLVGRDVLIGAAAGTIGSLLIASRQIIPHLLHLPLETPQLPVALVLFGTRYAIDGALETIVRALGNALQVVCVLVFLRIVLRRTWLVMVIGTLLMVPIAMSGTFAAEQLAIELAIALAGIALVFGVLLQFGLLALVVTFYTFLTMEVFPITTDLSRPYAGASVVLLLTIGAVSAYGFYASRGDEPLFGRALLD